MQRTRGFLREAVKEIQARPGQTANEIVERLLAIGRAASSAQDPVGSLVATLTKHHAEKSVRREWRDGQYRYYPVTRPKADEPNGSLPNGNPSSCDEVTIKLPEDCKEFIDALVVLPQFTSRREVVMWLVRKGMESTRVS